MSNYKKLSKNIVLMVIGQFSSKLLSFILVPLYTYILSTEEYGTFDLITTTVTLLTPALTLVIFEGVMRFCLDENYNKNEVLTIGLLFTAIGSFLVLLGYPVFCLVPTLKNNFLWVFLFFLFNNLHNVLTQYLKAIDRVKLYSICGIISTAVTLVMNFVFLVVLKWAITGYFIANLSGCILVCLIISYKINIFKLIVNPFKIEKKVYKDILGYTCPMIPNSISWWISNSSDKYMISAFASVAVLGIYSVSYKIPSVLSIVTSIFMSAWQISAVENFGTEESKAFYSDIYKSFSSCIILVASTLIFLSKYTAYFLFQKDFFSAWKVSMILIMAFIFNSISALLGSVYTSSKKTKMLFYSTLLAAISNIALNFLLIPFYGMYGAAYATLISYVLVWIVRLIDIRKSYYFEINLKTDIFGYILCLIMVVLLSTEKSISVIISAVLLIVIYIFHLKMLVKTNVFEKIKSKLNFRRIKNV